MKDIIAGVAEAHGAYSLNWKPRAANGLPSHAGSVSIGELSMSLTDDGRKIRKVDATPEGWMSTVWPCPLLIVEISNSPSGK